jgi:hypothetical protein
MNPAAYIQTVSNLPGEGERRAGRVMVDGLTCSQGRVIDMNASSLRLSRSTRWRPGEIRRVSLPVLAGRTMPLVGICRWCRKVGFFKWVCEVEFLDLTDDHREALRYIALTNAKREWVGVARKPGT